MKKLTLALSVLSLSIASSFAQADTMSQEQKVSGFYLGGAIGKSSFSSSDITTEKMSEDDTSLKFLAGYQFNRVVGIEFSYVDFGKFETSRNTQYYSQKQYTISPTAFTLAANLGYTFHSGFRPFALIGLSQMNLNEGGEYSNYYPTYFEDDKGTAFHIGAGVEFAPASLNGLAFRAALESDILFVSAGYNGEDISSLPFTNLNIGATYKF